MPAAHTLRRGTRRYSLYEYGGIRRAPEVDDWARRVVVNGGAMPSEGTISALNTFYIGLTDAGVLSKMKAVCCFVPDSLIAAITPLIKLYGNDPWTNASFVAGDLTAHGLKGDGSTKYLNTGVIPSTAYANNGIGGLTIYTPSDVGTVCTYEMSVYANVSGSLVVHSLYHSCSGTDYFDAFNQTTGRVGGANSSFQGYVSGNRTAINAAAIYKANSATAHTTVASSSTSNSSTMPDHPIFCFANNNDMGGATTPSSKRFSFAAIHDGLTSGESSSFYNLIQQMRTDLGGGYV